MNRLPQFLYTNFLVEHDLQGSALGESQINVFLEDGFDFIEVTNMNGEVLLKQNLSGKTGKISIPVSPTIAGGLYVVQLKNEDRTITQKIVIQ